MPDKSLQRFINAQNDGQPSVFDQALAELRQGRKSGHWIWFVLPQLRGIGHSEMANIYGIADLSEARDYLADSLLRQRLGLVISVIDDQLNQPGLSLAALMGGELDAAKTVSSLTLFEAAGLAAATPLLERIGRRCALTLSILQTLQPL